MPSPNESEDHDSTGSNPAADPEIRKPAEGEAESNTATVDQPLETKKRRKTIPNMLDIAYTAGLLDGEGSIQINPHSTHNGKKSLGLTIQISSNEKPLIDWLLKTWGFGTLTSWKSASRKLSYNWRVFGGEWGKILLGTCYPHLIIKKQKAALALTFCALPLKKTMPNKEKIIKLRVDAALLMRELNKSGKGARRAYADHTNWR